MHRLHGYPNNLRQEIKEKIRAHTLLNKVLVEEKAKANALNGQIGKLEGENQTLKQDLAQRQEVNETLASQMATLEQSLGDAREELAETKTALAQSKQERADETEAQVGKLIELLNTRLGES